MYIINNIKTKFTDWFAFFKKLKINNMLECFSINKITEVFFIYYLLKVKSNYKGNYMMGLNCLNFNIGCKIL